MSDPNAIDVPFGRVLNLTSEPTTITIESRAHHARRFLESLHDNSELPTTYSYKFHTVRGHLYGRPNLSMFDPKNANQDLLLFAHT